MQWKNTKDQLSEDEIKADLHITAADVVALYPNALPLRFTLTVGQKLC